MLCLLAAVGCSSSNFEIAESTDSGTSDETASDTGIGPVEDGAPPADSSVEEVIAVDAGCAAPSDPLEIWVDGASANSPTGTASCPFHKVSEAIAYANTLPMKPRTIRVKPGSYVEDTAIILRKGLTLSGSGVGVTQLSGGGACTSSTSGYKCVIRVDSGAILERVSIDASPNGKHGVVTGEAEGVFPIVRSTAISGAGGSCCSGILVNSGAILGPNIESSKNAYGLTIWGNQTVKVLAGTNKFDNNTLTGINHEGTGVFSFEGGSVSSNR
jgi:pectin methylesterase-like acyl-CoA thioesterase